MILVAGAIANKPLNGGESWVRLNWTLGLARLGHPVHLVEQIAPEACIDAGGRPAGFRESLNAAFFAEVVREFGLERSATLICGEGPETLGLPFSELVRLVERADLVVNISGHLRSEPLLERARLKVFVDLDPGFTQVWHARGDPDVGVAGHDHHYTVGANVGLPGCPIPTGGIDWRPVMPPVVLDLWPVVAGRAGGSFTTVARWRNPYGPLEWDGVSYGLKHHELRRVIELPGLVESPLEIALDIHAGDSADLEALRSHGWRVSDPREVVPDPRSFRRYVQASAAEFSVAQGIYTDTRSGWFSDRTATYLASGKPALVQDTGLGDGLASGEGMLRFRTLAEAVDGVERIVADYDAHAQAARALAERHLDSDRVLGELLADVGVGS